MVKRSITCSIYCVKEDDVLLLKRRKFPFAGYWVAPGGKVDPLEAPNEAAHRELLEETGLTAERLRLRGVVSESTVDTSFQSVIFYYIALGLSGELISEGVEGELAWWSIQDVPSLHIPEADKIFMSPILDLRADLFEAHFEYDENMQLLNVRNQKGVSNGF